MANTGSPFLYASGTSNNGQNFSALTVMSTELNSLAGNTLTISSSAFTPYTSLGGTPFGNVVLTLGGSSGSITPAAGQTIAGFWLETINGATTYENSAVLLGRNPDFVIPLPNLSINYNTQYRQQGRIYGVQFPAFPFKVAVFMYPTSGATSLFSTLNTLQLAGPALTY